MARRGLTRIGWLGAVALVGCVLGFRGEASFQAEHDLTGTAELRIELPDTPLSVVACAADDEALCPATLRYEGRWLSVAGTREDARNHAAEAVLSFERDAASTGDRGAASLRAEVPLAVAGTVDLEMGVLTLPDDRHLDLRTGVGDVSVLGTVASVVVDVEVGDVEIRGADGGLAVRTGLGDLDVETPGHADLHTGRGRVSMQQTGSPRDLWVRTDTGDITVTLASDADIDLEIHTRGTISVRTESITAITSGHFARRNGNGSVHVELHSPRGAVEVRTR